MAQCRFCKSEIKWLITVPGGKRMPCQPNSVKADGTHTVITDEKQEIIISPNKTRVFEPNKLYANAQPGLIGYEPHFAYCTEYKKAPVKPITNTKVPEKPKKAFTYYKIGESWAQLWCNDMCIGHIEIYQPTMLFYIEVILDELNSKTNSGKAILNKSGKKNKSSQTKLNIS